MLMNILSEKLSLFRDSDILETGSFFTRQLLPWNNVAVMLHLCEHDTVAEADVRSSPGMSCKIDGLCCSAYEDYLRRVPSVDEVGDFSPGVFVRYGRFFAYPVDSSVDVGVVLVVESIQGLDDLNRFL